MQRDEILIRYSSMRHVAMQSDLNCYVMQCNKSFFFSARPKKIDLFSSLNNNFSKHRYSRHISQHNLVQASKLSLKYAHWSRQINTGRIFQTFQIMQDRWRTSEKLSRSCSPCPRHHPLHCSSGVEVSALPVL